MHHRMHNWAPFYLAYSTVYVDMEILILFEFCLRDVQNYEFKYNQIIHDYWIELDLTKVYELGLRILCKTHKQSEADDH